MTGMTYDKVKKTYEAADLTVDYLTYNYYGPYQIANKKDGKDVTYLADNLRVEDLRT